ncbi:MAG: cofactor-independent phosphoglycerate mutase [Deltaproteobacteria bacterium]|nr:cofactor-independent phosphoglycerate mutase [Deltaproteobacteria bacterium]NIS76959.1 cofactor-independent phosphoglycerate mutase [Deltaproteobacteria bacterium]
MKYVVVIGDGMADWKVDSLGRRTPLEAASKPHADFMAKNGVCGLAQIVSKDMYPGSDVSNISILGYDPKEYYTGRSPLEAASIGVDISPTDVAVRCNIVTIEGAIPAGTMVDYSAGHISTEESRRLLTILNAATASLGVEFFPGVSYRNLMVWRNGRESVTTVPPHDIMGKPIRDFLPSGEGSEVLVEIMKKSMEVFSNQTPEAPLTGGKKNSATSVWLWGQGKAPKMPPFEEKFGVAGSIIAAVDLIRGIGIYLGMDIVEVPGATGYIDTNFEGKGKYCLQELEKKDFVLVHVEAPDEAGHNGDAADKVKAIEDIDRHIIGPILERAKGKGDLRVLFLPDHPTPVAIRTHSNEPVPFVMYPKLKNSRDFSAARYTEDEARKTGYFVERGFDLMPIFLGLKS